MAVLLVSSEEVEFGAAASLSPLEGEVAQRVTQVESEADDQHE